MWPRRMVSIHLVLPNETHNAQYPTLARGPLPSRHFATCRRRLPLQPSWIQTPSLQASGTWQWYPVVARHKLPERTMDSNWGSQDQ
jgi:hypothetical protein